MTITFHIRRRYVYPPLAVVIFWAVFALQLGV